jgi:hypothetical protein
MESAWVIMAAALRVACSTLLTIGSKSLRNAMTVITPSAPASFTQQTLRSLKSSRPFALQANTNTRFVDSADTPQKATASDFGSLPLWRFAVDGRVRIGAKCLKAHNENWITLFPILLSVLSYVYPNVQVKLSNIFCIGRSSTQVGNMNSFNSTKFLATDPEVRVRFPALPVFLRSSGSGTGSTQPREYKWGAAWKKK